MTTPDRGLDRSVAELMQTEMATVQHDERLDLAEDIMRLGRIRHLPVLEGERLAGILSSRDLLAASLSRALAFEPQQRRAFLRSVEVKEVMSFEVEAASPDESARSAARRMLRHKIGCLPVVDEEGRLVGLLTETDLLGAALGAGEEEEIVIDATDAPDQGAFHEEFEDLQRIRDELRVQVHLGKAEAKDLFARLERRFEEMEAHAQTLAKRAEEPAKDVAAAARLLLDEIKKGYRELRALL